MRGYFGVGIYNPSKASNLGSLFRSAQAFGANYIYTIGYKYKRDQADTGNSKANIPYFNFESVDEFIAKRAGDIICVELLDKSIPLSKFSHPSKACYLLGNESTGIPVALTDRFPSVIIPTQICLNVSVAGSVIMFDRLSKGEKV